MTSLSGWNSFACFSSGCMVLSTVPISDAQLRNDHARARRLVCDDRTDRTGPHAFGVFALQAGLCADVKLRLRVHVHLDPGKLRACCAVFVDGTGKHAVHAARAEL